MRLRLNFVNTTNVLVSNGRKVEGEQNFLIQIVFLDASTLQLYTIGLDSSQKKILKALGIKKTQIFQPKIVGMQLDLSEACNTTRISKPSSVARYPLLDITNESPRA